MRSHLFSLTALLSLCVLVSGCNRTPQPDVKKVVTPERVFPQAERMFAVAFSPDSSWFVAAGVEGVVRMYSVPGGEMVRSFTHPGGATWVDVSADGKWVATCGYDGNVRLWDAATGTLLHTLHGGDRTLWSVAFSPDGTRVASGGDDHAITIWHLPASDMEVKLGGHTRIVWTVQFSPDSHSLASGSFDRTAKIWDIGGNNSVRTLAGHTQAVVRLAYSPDGKLIASGGDDSKLRLWDVASGKEIRSMDQSPRHIDAVAFSPDGQYVVTGGKDHNSFGELVQNFFGENAAGMGESMHVYRVSDGALMQTISQHHNDVFGLAFSRDGKWMASASEDKSVILWKVNE
jgi:WD40 repeat protein